MGRPRLPARAGAEAAGEGDQPDREDRRRDDRVPGRHDRAGDGYDGDANVTFTLTLGTDYLPRKMVERYHTPGGNLPYVQYTTSYGNWGKGDPIEPPS